MSTPKVTVLVVDDEAPIRTLVSRALQERNYEVLVAADGPEALRMADAHPSGIDLLLADIMLPSGNGIALARELLVKRPDTAVLYMSGFQSEAIQAVQGGGAPAGGFIEKPFTPEVLIDRVRAIVEPVQQTKVRHHRDPARPLSPAFPEESGAPPHNSEAVYRLESAARCPYCRETISTLKAVRLLRTQVNFISTLPRRGRVALCPCCLAILPVELTNF